MIVINTKNKKLPSIWVVSHYINYYCYGLNDFVQSRQRRTLFIMNVMWDESFNETENSGLKPNIIICKRFLVQIINN